MALSNAGTSSKTTDGSAIISLGELFKLEERRVEEEQERQRRRREESEQARRARIEREREQLEAQKRQQEQHRAERERAEAEDAARLAGMLLGFIARAKVEAEAKAADSARQAEHARAMELERLRASDSGQWLRRGLAATAATGALAVATLLGAYFGSIAPQYERALSQAQADTAASQDDARRVQAQLDERRRRDTEQTTRLASLERERDAYRTQAQELARALAEAGPKGARGTPAASKPPETTAVLQKCQYEGDPMCGLER